jgi:hypothetical protein
MLRNDSALGRGGNANRGAQIGGLHQLAVAHDELHLPEIADVLLRVAVDQREFGELSPGTRWRVWVAPRGQRDGALL